MIGAKNMKLKGAMASKGITIQALADRVGMSYSTLQLKISGKSTFDTDEAKKIMSALDLTQEEAADIFLGVPT